ncbi:MAG: hypothetical protein NW220_10040 [Leptolyngbyaceae cyanobacterium bins.349]|nr:hypothetical protein [Leptolyngbyaceae cyanobacterium bins.349]
MFEEFTGNGADPYQQQDHFPPLSFFTPTNETATSDRAAANPRSRPFVMLHDQRRLLMWRCDRNPSV